MSLNRIHITRLNDVSSIEFEPGLETEYDIGSNVYTGWSGDITNYNIYDNGVDVKNLCYYDIYGGQYGFFNVQEDHIIVITQNTTYIKKDGQWKEILPLQIKSNNSWTNNIEYIFKKTNGSWQQSNRSALFDQNALFMSYDEYINTPYYGVSEFRVDKADLSAVFNTLGITFQDYLEDLNDYSTARCIPDKYIKVGELTVDGTTYYRYDGYVNNNTRHTESVGGNTYYVGMLVPSTFQFKRVNTIKYTALMPSQSINGYMILIDSNNTVYHTIPNSPLNTYSIFGQDEYPRVLVDFTI